MNSLLCSPRTWLNVNRSIFIASNREMFFFFPLLSLRIAERHHRYRLVAMSLRGRWGRAFDGDIELGHKLSSFFSYN